MTVHGTYAAYQRCRLDLAGPCDECRAACREYVRKYRSVVGIESDKKRGRARDRAFRRLSHLHRNEFQALMREELARDPIERKPRRPRGTVT